MAQPQVPGRFAWLNCLETADWRTGCTENVDGFAHEITPAWGVAVLGESVLAQGDLASASNEVIDTFVA